MKARWRSMLEGAREESLLTVDLYNQPLQPRRLEGFFIPCCFGAAMMPPAAAARI
jgi:hypothetical protein